MSKGQTLRALVNARLNAAAEEIFALFESTIAEFEEELCRSKAENQSKQELLDSAQNSTVLMVFQTPSVSPVQGPQQRITETPQIKEEPEEYSIKQEVEQSVCEKNKTVESSLLQQRQTELREDARGEDIFTETHLRPQTAGDVEHSFDTGNDEDWRATFLCSDAQMETEVNGEDNIHVQIRGTRSAAKGSVRSSKNKSDPETDAADGDTSESDGDSSESDGDTSESDGDTSESDGDTSESDGDTSESDGDTSESDEAPEWIKECPFCAKRFVNEYDYENHVRVHTGEKPFSCPVCRKTFARSSFLKQHMAVHDVQQSSCSICKKTFAQKNYLKVHMRVHAGEQPYSCSVCEKTFSSAAALHTHKRSHTEGKSYVCQTCGRAFLYSSNLKQHMLQHTGEKPFSCSICEKTFTFKGTLVKHIKIHNQDK